MKNSIDGSLVRVDESIGACLNVAALIAALMATFTILVDICIVLILIFIDVSLGCTNFGLPFFTAPLRLLVFP